MLGARCQVGTHELHADCRLQAEATIEGETETTNPPMGLTGVMGMMGGRPKAQRTPVGHQTAQYRSVLSPDGHGIKGTKGQLEAHSDG